MKRILKWFGILIGLFVVLMIVAAIASGGNSGPEADTVASAPTQAVPKVEVKLTEAKPVPTVVLRPTAIPSPTPTTSPAAPTAIKAPALTLETLPAHLETTLPPEAKGKVDLDSDGVYAQFKIADGFGLDTVARKSARDFIFAAYATKLPIKTAQVVISQPDGKIGLSLTLGANVAKTQPESTWTDRAVGPTVFMNWMKDKAKIASNKSGPDRAYIGGSWAD